jgi:hypothetical protein
MKFTRLILVRSGHNMHVAEIPATELPAHLRHREQYTTFYVVRNFGATGPVFFYLGKGHPETPKQVVAWYPNGQMWSSFGDNLKGAIEGAQEDGWKYAVL